MAKTINLFGHSYELMSAKTERAKRIYDAFCSSSDYELYHVYGSFSRAKENAMDYCRARERECNSTDGVITSYCIMQFTYAFTCESEGKRYLVYITKSHDYVIDLDALQQGVLGDNL